MLDKLQYFIWDSILHFTNKQWAETSNYFIFTFLLLLLAYNYTWIISCLGVIILHLLVCTVIHNCSSSGSLFFVSLRQNN